ncbi:hypothetical protein IPA_02725 [Ignicoccus pacificus DSM 13166]|uniref:Bile acid:sodium symporter n=1 Tax=Ignicoccus pacificus DSM 13166 TaxID=940294 RepID=A0A977KAR7_9CREN|nr:hypothetical protein IPA_02725 [Ignicoccus pacificus DSM 13166]
MKFLQERMMEILLIEAVLFTALGSFVSFKPLKPTVPFAVFFMILQPMMVMNFKAFFEEWHRKAKLILLILILYSVAFPLLTWAFASAWFKVSVSLVAVGAVLTALAPVAMPAPTFVSALGGDVELSVASIIVTFLASLVVMPTWAYLILHKTVNVPIGMLVKAIAEYIILPLIVGQILRYVTLRSGSFEKVNKVLLDVSLLAMYYLIATIFGSASHAITSLGLAIAFFMVMVYVYYSIRFGMTYGIGKALGLNWKELIALVYAASVNGALGMAVSLGAYGPEAAAGAVLAGPLGVLVIMILLVKFFKKKSLGKGGG